MGRVFGLGPGLNLQLVLDAGKCWELIFFRAISGGDPHLPLIEILHSS